jgi:flagellar L-ring protein precursor FlgH
MTKQVIRVTGALLSACGLAVAQTTSHNNNARQRPQAQHPPQLQQSQQTQQEQPPPPPTPAEAYQRSGGSLLRASLASQADASQAPLASVSFFAVPEPEPRVIKKHDLVTIIVREESSFSSDGETELKKEAEFEARLEEFIKINKLLSDLQLTGGGVTDPVPSIKMTGTRDFKGEGSVDRTDRLTLRVTAEVVDVKPNGTLVLQARQRIKTDEEEQTFILSGICRAADVTADNTVLSSQMFDKDLTKTHKGTVREATKRGWLSKLLDVVSPF